MKKTDMSYLDYLRSFPTVRADNSHKEEIAGVIESRSVFDSHYLSIYDKEPLYIERLLLTHVVDIYQLQIHFEYISGNSGQTRAFAYKRINGEASGIFLDEVLDLSLIDVFLTVWAAAYCPAQINICRKNFIYLIKDVLVNRERFSKKRTMIIQDVNMPDIAVEQALDLYWAAWIFMVGHELFHLKNQEALTTREEEFKADCFGFQVLLRLIAEQKAGTIPKEIASFYEEVYLAPCMLMEIFRIMDIYRINPVEYGSDNNHPSPEERFQAIIDLYDTEVPDDMDTENGNAFLGTFLDVTEQLVTH